MERINLKIVTLFYAALFLVAMLWTWLRGDLNPFVHPEWDFSIGYTHIFKGILLGIASAVTLVVISRLSAYYFPWARKLEGRFAELLGPLKMYEIVVISVLSGFAEEAFFRGAMQPSIGLIPTTVLFGALHIGPSRDFLPWTVSATLVGGLLGWYFQVTGTLAAPIACHILVNLVNLIFIQRYFRADVFR